MATVAELAAADHREVAYLLVVEGWPWAFTDRSEIAGAGPGSWIGEDHGPREVLDGLTVPETITYATTLENGMLDSGDGATFTIRDFDRHMIGLIDATNVGTVIGETVGPKDDPAPTTLLDAVGNPVNVWGLWLNNEAIGDAGQRRFYGCMPLSLPGPDHAAWSAETQTLAPSILRDSPTWHEGTRCALYMIYRDLNTGAWPSWQDQHDSGESLLWYGTTTELECEGLEWSLTCDGPSSWLRRQLGGNRSAEWRPVGSTLTLATDAGGDQSRAAYYFDYRAAGSWEQGAASFYAAGDVLPTSGTAADYRAAINARVATVSGTLGTAGVPAGGVSPVTWTTQHTASCQFLQGRIEVVVDNQQWAAYAYVCLHERVWRVLGYDPHAQAGSTPDGDPYVIDFLQPENLLHELAGFAAVPGPGYFLARVSTVAAQYGGGAYGYLAAGSDLDNGGQPRTYLAIHGEDLTTLYPDGDQEIRVGLGVGSVPYLESQLCRKPAEHAMTNSGGDVDSAAFVAFRGSYRSSAEAEVKTMAALARVGFVDDPSFGGHGPAPDADGYLKLHVHEYIDPRFVGIDRRFDGPWSALDLEWAPINYLGYNTKAGDRADLLLLRTMLSSGTASWSGYDGQGATQTLGDNAHPDADAPQGSDAEIADLGLAIPADLIDAASFVATADALPNGGKNSPLNRVKFAWLGSFDSQDFVWRVIEQRGWGVGFVRGQFRLFPRSRLLDSADVEVAFGPDDFAVDDVQFVERADLRPLSPRDGYEVRYGEPLVEGAGSDLDLVATVRASDPQSRTRRTNNVESIDGRGLIPTRLWGTDPGAPPSWISTWSTLAGRDLASWYAQPWVAVDVPVRWSVARQIGPGSVVSFSSLYAPNREGTYGLANRLGRVVSKTINLEELSAEVRVLVQPGDPAGLRRFAPVAVVLDDVATVEERHSAGDGIFYCYADFFGHGEGGSDVAYFGEPAWSAAGGNALVNVWQWDGRTWNQTAEFEVQSVDTSAHTIRYGTFSGTWYEARPTVLTLANYDSQDPACWARSVFSVITTSTGVHGGVPTPGFPLVNL